jgi:hypothetical protein
MEKILYLDAAKQFAKSYNKSPNDHIIDIIASVMMTRDGVLHGGHFAQAVVNNDLFSAVTRADEEVLKELKLITLANHNAFLENLLPRTLSRS